ncbi:MAG TPA: SdiA-regulated domain-containing protein [Gemmatimonadaceae bacterium]|nr:SdiA-regulated domain-containing protein [Gemmatimonadaceae bacterium]
MIVVRRVARVLLVALAACDFRGQISGRDSVLLAERVSMLEERLADSVSSAARSVPVARWVLPPGLNEVSGLARTSDGRLLAHGDELGRIAVLDPRRGVLLKEFSINARADFEGITIAKGSIYMVTSNGNLYVFREGANNERVRYELHDTRLGRECEFEGVAYDSRRAALLLPCKNVEKKNLRGHIVIYVWPLTPGAATSVLTVPLRQAIGENAWRTLRPTDITIDPTTGHYILVAAQEKAIIEITPNGAVVGSFPLPNAEQHGQPEGLAITEDGILIVADEATRAAATLTLYRWPLAPATQVAP